jgi:hypothetical protein
MPAHSRIDCAAALDPDGDRAARGGADERLCMFAKDLGFEYARSCFRSQDRPDFAEVTGLYAEMRAQALRDLANRIRRTATYLQPPSMRYADQFHEVEIVCPRKR